MIKSLIDKLPDEEASLLLLEKFDRLLRKYARLLNTEDGYEELRLFFFELLESLQQKTIRSDNDGYIVNYISKAVRNHYIALSKKHHMHNVSTFSELSEEQQTYVEQLAATEDHTDISAYFSTNALSDRERMIMRMLFDEMRSVDEIAKILKVSRQAVNQSKIRALKKIRTEFFKE